jgi:long-subunit fatty acid transport protein
LRFQDLKEIQALLNKNQPVKNTTGSVKINCKIPETLELKGNSKTFLPSIK